MTDLQIPITRTTDGALDGHGGVAGPAGAPPVPSTAGMTLTGRAVPGTLRTVVVDLYRDIHKGIRAELFAVVGNAGSLDPADREGRAALAGQVRDVVGLLDAHAGHEDRAILPVLAEVRPDLHAANVADHEVLERHTADLVVLADDLVDAPSAEARTRTHHLHLELATFTGAYLLHQDVEERVIMPALEDAVGVDAVAAVHGAIIGGIGPEEMARSLAVMIPAMNVEDRVELLGGMQAGAPPEVFAGLWGLVGTVLEPADTAVLARRLDIA